MKQLSPLRQYLLRGSAWAFFGKLLAAFSGLGLSAVLTRVLQPEDVGVFLLALNIATFLAIIARFGLERSLLRFISEALGRGEKGAARKVLDKGLILTFAISLSLALLVYLGLGEWLAEVLFKSAALSQSTLWIAFWLIFLALQFLLADIFRAFQQIGYAVLFGSLLTSLLSFLFLGLSWWLTGPQTLTSVLSLVLLANLINALVGLWLIQEKRRLLKRTAAPNPAEHSISYKSLAVHTWPLFINNVTMFMLAQSDIWILGAYLSEEDVAIYGTAVRLVLLTGLALTIVNAVVPPLIAKMNVQNQQARLERLLRTTATLASLPAIAVLAVFVVFGKPLLGLLFGDFYAQGWGVLAIRSIGQAASVLAGSCAHTLVMTGQRKTLMWISASTSLISILSGIWSVQTFGKEGLALAFTVAFILQQVFMVIAAKRLAGVWTHFSFNHLWIVMKQLPKMAKRSYQKDGA